MRDPAQIRRRATEYRRRDVCDEQIEGDWFEPEVKRIAGEIMLKSSERNTAKAQACFERALSVARPAAELRAALSMARLWRDHGRRVEARERLAPVYGWFTEGFDTLDLKDAKALLDELSS